MAPNKKAAGTRNTTTAANANDSRLPHILPRPSSISKPYDGHLLPRSEAEIDFDEQESDTIAVCPNEALSCLDRANAAFQETSVELNRLVLALRRSNWYPRDFLPSCPAVCTFAETAVRNLQLAIYHLSVLVTANANSKPGNRRG